MNLSIPSMPIRVAAVAGLALALLAGCKPHETHGTVDEANAITVEEIAKLSLEDARAKYAGKVVTFKNLKPVGISAMNQERQNVCMQGFLNIEPVLNKGYPSSVPGRIRQAAGISVYFNFGDEIDKWFEDTPYRPEDLKLDTPLVVDFDVCDQEAVCSEGDFNGSQKCRFSSDRLLVAGKVAAIFEMADGASLHIAIRPTGLRY